MNIGFNSNIANALVNGHPVPTPLIHHFVQEAYDTFQYAQKAFASNKDYESNIKHLENEMSVVKAALLNCEEELKETIRMLEDKEKECSELRDKYEKS